MKLHPRAALVSRARLDIDDAVARVVVANDLTPLEAARILLTLAERQTTVALRFERHGRYDKKADEA